MGIADVTDLETRIGSHVVTPVFAGLSTGFLFGSSRGIRAATLASVIGASCSCAVWYGGAYAYNVLLRRY